MTTLVIATVVAGATVPVYGRIFDLGADFADLSVHSQLLVDSQTTGQQLGYSGYYALLDVLSGRTLDPEALRSATVGLLAASTGLRVGLAYAFMALSGVRAAVAAVLSVAILVMAPLTLPGGDHVYLGKFSPAIWHNSTTILAVPFSLVAFALIARYLEDAHPPRWLHLAVPASLILCAVAKPNYMLALVPAVALWMGCRVVVTPRGQRATEMGRLLRPALVIGLSAIVVLGIMYLTTFGGEGITIAGLRVSLGVRPGEVWAMLTRNPAWSLVASFLTPLLATLAVWRVARASTRLQLAWLAVTVAVAEFVILAEVLSNGDVLGHANWMWGAQIGTFVLYVVCGTELARRWKDANRWKWVAAALGVAQVALGVVFLWLYLSGNPPTAIRL